MNKMINFHWGYFVHTFLFLNIWNHPIDIHTCQNQSLRSMDPHKLFVFATYTAWIAFELGGYLMKKPEEFRKDMFLHHFLTTICVLIGWHQGLMCIGYATVRNTLLCECAVDFYFAFKNSNNVWLKALAETGMVVLFPYTRVWLMFQTVVGPILVHYTSFFNMTPTHIISSLGLFFLFGMQIMWSMKIARGVYKKIMNKGGKGKRQIYTKPRNYHEEMNQL
jgi:hypothetical protein